MKEKLHILLMTLALLAPSAMRNAAGQEYIAPPVAVSREKVKVDGKLYYSHIVAEKQTLYSISKAYGVSIEEIYSANPALQETGLKKNAIILIPAAHEEKARQEEKAAVKEEKAAQDAEKKEARKNRRQEKNEYFTHTVKWYEDIDGIARRYGISTDALMQINGLTGRKLSSRQKLKIPADPQAYMESHSAVQTIIPQQDIPSGDTASAQGTSGESGNPAPQQEHSSKSSINAVLMLPFNTSGEKQNENSMDFYSGALLAARDLGNEGLSIDLSVYDTGGGVLPITYERLRISDVVIGPVASREISELLARTPESTCIISPLDHRADTIADIHPNFIQAPASTISQYEDLAQWVKEDRKGADKVFIIHEKGSKNTGELTILQQMLSANGIEYTSFSYSILEGRSIIGTLSGKMAAEGENRVLIASESEAFVNDVIRNLNLLVHKKYPVTLYGASKIKSFETIDVENLHNINLHVSQSYHIDYNDPKVMEFLMKYRALYNTEPTRFAFQGYDTVHYFCSLSSRYGDIWPQMLTASNAEMLQSSYRFTRKGNGGYINTGIRRVIYGPDYSIIEYR
ncbi:MAG: LysM peptidoglycan-binding domain-containing protein [Clostridium sp.]|nr:LysM peptidoglycan-binding domain-containing protein [Bacteroides sp.]MCM1197514.1 LysM peptidoglycan-binding domain-containing protein [Clostridium sp.]